MTKEQRIANIVKYKERKDLEKLRSKDEEAYKVEILKGEVRKLNSRITDMCEVADTCNTFGIPISNFYVPHNEIGFVPCDKIEVGLYVDNSTILVTDGCVVVFLNTVSKQYSPPSSYAIQKFLNLFDEFEENFYKYVDSFN